jgi:hypothetical protein
VILLTSVIHAALYSRDWFGAVRTEATTPRHTPDPCTTNNRMKEGIPHFIPTEQSFTSIDWLSSAAAPMDPGPEDSQHVRFAGPDVLLDESDLASCFTFSGEHGGVTIVSNSSRHRITHFTLDNSLVNGVIDPTYYPRDGSLWGLFEGELPLGLGDLVISHVSPTAVYILLGSFCFSPEAGPSQTYTIDPPVASCQEFLFSVFYLGISSNWGGSHTCVGRLRLHELD